MRDGWEGNTALQDLLNRADGAAQLMVEKITVESSDIKDLKSDWDDADTPLTGLTILPEGGIRLELVSVPLASQTTEDGTQITDLDHADPGKGDILFDGVSLQSMSGHQRNLYRNKSVGFVFQFYHLLPELNVLENTMLAGMVGRQPWYWYFLLAAGIIPGLIYEEFKYRIERARLHGRAASLLESFGLQHRLTHRPRELSGGERQRVAIARALMNEPKILLADEPTGNLDETTGGEILDLIAAQHKKGLTIVMVTHDQAIADRADRVVQLHDGRVQ